MEDTTMMCSICDELFNSEQELRRHQLTVHAAAVSSHRRSDYQDELDAEDQETAA
jgi:hypothetical protein